MDKEAVCTTELPGEHWKRPRPGFGQAYESFWKFHRRTEDRLRRRICKRCPDMSYEEAEAIVAIQMLKMFENRKEKFLVHLPTASDRGLTESTEAEPPADDLNQQFSAFMVKWRV
jgi:hypothetical protein